VATDRPARAAALLGAALSLAGCTIPIGPDFGGDRRPARPVPSGSYVAPALPRKPLRIEREFSWDLGEPRVPRAAPEKPAAPPRLPAAVSSGEVLQQEPGDFWAR
jgi:hypothetical protein